MKKIGIITLNGYFNYGNRLQNYALKQYIEDINSNTKVETIEYISFPVLKRKIKSCIKYLFLSKQEKKRLKNLKNFSKNYLNIKRIFFKKNIVKKYDYLIVGSDQVWNYNLQSVDLDLTLLKFSPKYKNISYAASFGISEIENSRKQEFKKSLNNFKNISVRENNGKKIIKELGINNTIEVLIDPTLLLEDKWNNLIVKPKNKTIPKKYILLYFLGNINKKQYEEIERLAKENNAEIINILDKNNKFYDCNPFEFLYLEKNAFLICTDSFHSSVFSMLFNVPFVVYKRDNSENMYSRINDFLNLFDLEDRKYKNKLTNKYLKHNYNNSFKILKLQKEESKDFIYKSLNIM